MNTELGFKADKTYTDTQLLTKANKTDVYLKTETYSTSEIVNAIQAGINTRQETLFAGAPENGVAMLSGNVL